MINQLPLVILSSLCLASCTQVGDVEQPAESAHQAEILPIKSSEMVIKFQIGEADARDWTITPALSPDTLVLECPEDKTVPVTFTTDVETRTIPMTLAQDSVQFDVIVNDDIVALTELKCIEEIARYTGDYSADRATAGDHAADLAPLLETYFQSDGPGAIVSIVEGDQPPFATAIGLDDIAGGTDRRVDEAFDIASVSKEFTSVSIMQLAEQGALSIEDPVSKYFGDLPNGDDITLHHLLTHTHGLPQIRAAEDYDDMIPRTLETSLGHIRAQGAQFAPGEQYAYGNTSYYLLAIIAEQVSGIDRATYIRERLFEPAGMTESSLITEDPDSERRVRAYNELDGVHEPRQFDFDLSGAFGAGEIVSTLGDLRRWQRAVSNGTLISADMFAQAVAPKTLNDGSPIDRGYGFLISDLDGELIIYNTGDFFTHTRHFYMPSRDLTIILNTNGTPQYDGGQSSVVWAQIVGKVLNRQIVPLFGEEVDLNDP